MSVRQLILILAVGALGSAGCLSPVRQNVDDLVCRRAVQTLDEPPPGFLEPRKETKPEPAFDPKKPPTLLQRLEVPANVPGSEAPKLILPKDFLKLTAAEREKALSKYFPAQLNVGGDPQPVAGPEGQPLSLADLQKLAREHSPLLRQAASDIEGAEGVMIQVGLYNNPTLNYMSSAQSLTNGSIMGPTALTETIVTMGKRKLARAAAAMDLENAKLAYRRAEIDLMASVRSGYFAVLIAEEGMRANRALMELTDQVYKVMVIQLRTGQVAPYEPSQVSVFAGQARVAYIQSRNTYLQSWKNLATAIGLTMMPATELSGSIAKNLPRFDFEKALAYILQNHTDARTAVNGIQKARYLLRLAEVTPYPDITIGAGFLLDSSIPRTRLVPGVISSVPIPVFDRNQGGIRQAQAALVRAVEEPHRVENALTASLVNAFRRLDENRQVLELYHKQLLPQQVQAFRAAVQRHFVVGGAEVAVPGSSTAYLSDLVAADQALVGLIAAYLTSLQAYWQAASDTASLLQTDDVYQMASEVSQLPEFDFAKMMTLPCCHPCSSLKPLTATPPDGEEAEAAVTSGRGEDAQEGEESRPLPRRTSSQRPQLLPPPESGPPARVGTSIDISTERIDEARQGGAR